MELRDLAESVALHALAEARVDRASSVIRGVVLMNATSANGAHGRFYSERALKDIARLSEGLPAYANHVRDRADAFKPRDIREMVGRYRAVKYEGSKARVTGDLHVLPEATWLLNLAEHMGDVIGLSPVSRGAVRLDPTGREIVEEVVAVRSIDVVSDPATTKGLFENKETHMDNVHTRLRCALQGQPYVDVAATPSIAELREQAEREQRIAQSHEPVEIPAGTHIALFEALTGEQVAPADAHDRMRRALLGRAGR